MERDQQLMNIHAKVVGLIDSCGRFAVALVLKASGSTPQKAGVRAAVEANGKVWGTIGGGIVEAETQRRAVEACESGRPVVFDFHLDNAYARDAGAICGGSMRILIDPATAKDRACYAQAAEALQQRKRGVLLTTVRTGVELEVTVKWYPEEAIPSDADFPGAKAISSCLARETAKLFLDDSPDPHASVEVLVEPVVPQPLVMIVGGGHIGQALALQAVLVGFDVTVVDDRPEFTNPDLFPEGVKTRCGDIPKEVAAFPIDKNTYIVIVNRGHKHDAETLEACIHSRAAYIGMIGSQRKVELVRKNFVESGIATQEEFDRVFAPIGLDIGAITVPEIAMSIAAQLIAVRRKGDDKVPR
jgi:xanthine dehydrogenase accessory factor